MTKVRCPFHAEHTASLVRYKDHWRCYGACGRNYSIEEVAAKGVTGKYDGGDYEIEDVRARIECIRGLPKKEIRGFCFHADEGGYYIVWPDSAYYKYRRYDGKPKYIGAKAPLPMFWVRRGTALSLLLVEGEINAMSVAQSFPGYDVASPSSTTKFTSDAMAKHLTELKKYAMIVVVLDKDSAGDAAEVRMRIFFRSNNIPFVHYIRLNPDANEILCQSGKEQLRQEINQQMSFGLPG